MEVSQSDSRNFGIKIARARPTTLGDLNIIDNYCCKNQIKMTIVRIPTNNFSVIHEMENRGHQIMDTLIYWKIEDLKNKTIPENDCLVPIRRALHTESRDVEQVAKESFKDYYGHYHADNKLNRDDCTRVYSDWARRLVEERVVFIARYNEWPVGFGGIVWNTDVQAEYVLGGIIREYQGKRIYRGILINIMNWCKQNDMVQLKISTQINNFAVQKVWARLGLEPYYSEYTFHKWYDEIDWDVIEKSV